MPQLTFDIVPLAIDNGRSRELATGIIEMQGSNEAGLHKFNSWGHSSIKASRMNMVRSVFERSGNVVQVP